MKHVFVVDLTTDNVIGQHVFTCFDLLQYDVSLTKNPVWTWTENVFYTKLVINSLFCKHYNGCIAWATVSFNWFGVRLTTSPFHVTADNVEETCVRCIAYNRQCSWTTFSDMFRPAAAWCKANKNSCLNRNILCFYTKLLINLLFVNITIDIALGQQCISIVLV